VVGLARGGQAGGPRLTGSIPVNRLYLRQHASRRADTPAAHAAEQRDLHHEKGSDMKTPLVQREWVTPLTMGAFGLLATTGVLMFFHLDSGLNKTAHEWLGWVLVGGVALHAAVNANALKRHLASTRGRAVIGAFALLLALSFVPTGGGQPPFVQPVRSLANAPLPVLAQVGGVSQDEMRRRLAQAGLAVRSDDDTVARMAGKDLGRQMRVLSRVLAAPPA
jgi:hypothetical protein